MAEVEAAEKAPTADAPGAKTVAEAEAAAEVLAVEEAPHKQLAWQELSAQWAATPWACRASL